MVVRVMTVCTGNICRSPMAQVVLARRFAAAGLADRVGLTSRGISDEEAGNPIDRRARAVLVERGYPPAAEHRARRVDPSELAGVDLVLAMTAQHARVLRRLAATRPVDPPGAIVLYRRFDPALPDRPGAPEHQWDLADPWYGDVADFEVCLDQLEAGADGVVAQVSRLVADRRPTERG